MQRLLFLLSLCAVSSCSLGKLTNGNRLKLVRVEQQKAEIAKAPSDFLACDDEESQELGERENSIAVEFGQEPEEALREAGNHEEIEPPVKDQFSTRQLFMSWQEFQQKNIWSPLDNRENTSTEHNDPLTDLISLLLDEDPWVILLTMLVVALIILGLVYLPQFTTIVLLLVEIALIVGAIVAFILLIVGFCEGFQAFWNR